MDNAKSEWPAQDGVYWVRRWEQLERDKPDYGWHEWEIAEIVGRSQAWFTYDDVVMDVSQLLIHQERVLPPESD